MRVIFANMRVLLVIYCAILSLFRHKSLDFA